MSAWAITTPIGSPSDRLSIVNLTSGERLDLAREDGAMLADMLADAFPECEECGDRGCFTCETCDSPDCVCECAECPSCASIWSDASDAMACCAGDDSADGEPGGDS